MKFSSFVKNGFFPKELVPAFNSELFADKAEAILRSASGYKDVPSKLTSYTIPRLNNTRRVLTIMDPYHYLKLSKALIENWNEFEEAFNMSTYSLTKPVEEDGAIDSEYGYSEIIYRRCIDSVGYKYMLKTDISRFHNTIYTHMIPWVMHGKEAAKAGKNDKTILGNKIDIIIRAAKENQTLGIPTGQILFHIISERIAVYIDVELKKRFKKEVKEELEGFRYTDDFYFFFSNKGHAERALAILRGLLSELELELNYQKTVIHELPIPFEQDWVTEIRKYQFNTKLLSERNDIVNYFSYVFKYKIKYPDEFVIKYALARIKNKLFDLKNWNIYESLLLQCMSIETSVIPNVLEIILKYNKIDAILDKKKIKRVISNLVKEHIKLKHTYEVIWLLWMFKSLKIKVNSDVIDLLEESKDNFIILVSCDLENCKLLNRDLNKDNWSELISDAGLQENNWLLIYEGYIKGWLNVDKNIILNNNFYSKLLKNNIKFYYPENQINIEEFEIDDNDMLKEILEIIGSINTDNNNLKEQKSKLRDMVTKRNKNLGY